MRDGRAAAIYAADKLANTRDLLDADEGVRAERLDHYIKDAATALTSAPRRESGLDRACGSP